MASDSDRVPSSRAPALRCEEIRATAYLDPGAGFTIIHEDNAPGGAPKVDLKDNEGDAVFGKVFRVLGYDNVTLLFHVTRAATLSALNVIAETSWEEPGEENAKSASAEWFEVFEDLNNDGTVTRWQKTFPVVSTGRRLAIKLPLCGKNMRLKIWGTGAGAGDRALVRVIRSQDGRAGNN